MFDIQRAEYGAALIECDTTFDINADGVVHRNTDVFQRSKQVGMGDDAGAAAVQRFCRLLEDFDVPALAVQQVGGEQSAQRSADDQSAWHV